MRRGLPLILLSMLLSSCSSQPKQGPAARWSMVLEELPAALMGVWGTASDDVWAVGADNDDGGGPWVLHYDGKRWTRLPTGARGDLWWVTGFADGSVFMGGEQGLVLSYKGGEFTAMETPGSGTVFGIWGSSAKELWAVGGVGSREGFVWQLDRGVWRDVPVPGGIADANAMFKVWGEHKNRVWIAGADGHLLLHDGEVLREQDTPTEVSLFTVHGDGALVAAVGGSGQPVILERDGAGWIDVTPVTSPPLNGVWIDRGVGYAVGVGATILQRTGVGWNFVDHDLPPFDDLHAVWMDELGNVWAVGGQVAVEPLVRGMVVHGGAPTPSSKLKDFCSDGCERICLVGDPDCEGGPDRDGDGHVDASWMGKQGQRGGDCDDDDPTRFPGATEACNRIDDDCNGEVDDGRDGMDVHSDFFRDDDGDGFGQPGSKVQACFAPKGFVDNRDDCDDDDDRSFPGALELCDVAEKDEDCDGTGNNPAGGCSCSDGQVRDCPFPGRCAGSQQLCDAGLWSVECGVMPVEESCNGADDDCDGLTDEGLQVQCFRDLDDDGYAASGASTEQVCPDAARSQVNGCPAGWTHRAPVAPDVDCAPDDATRSPGSDEQCNGRDDNCNGSADEGLPTVARFIDADGDGSPGTPGMRCAGDPRTSDTAEDCMDDHIDVHPGQDLFFGEPACPDGEQDCQAADDSWHCRPSGSATCEDTLPIARWDYDCDGNDEQAPSVATGCSGTVCGDGCTGTGFLSEAAPACGKLQAHQRCACSLQAGICTINNADEPLGCR